MLKFLSNNFFFLKLLANLVFISLWFIKKTSNWTGINEKYIEEELDNKKSLIILIWHNQLMGSTFGWKFKPKLRPIATSHRDGQLSIIVQKKFGLDPLLRKKDNPTFLIKNISNAVKEGDCIYITPDAPHGPAKQINTNIFKLSKKYNLNVAILSFRTNKFIRINSWDKLKVPLPFSKGHYLWSKEIIKIKDFNNEEEFNKKVIFELNQNSKKIHDYF